MRAAIWSNISAQVRIKMVFFIAIILILGNVHSLFAESYSSGNIQISNVWARPTPGGVRTAAVYIEKIQNLGGKTDSLIKVSSPLANKNLIHKTIVKDGIARMRHINALELHGGHSSSLKPGNVHIMMFGVKEPLKEGSNFPMVFEFKNAGKIKVFVEIRERRNARMNKINQNHNHKH